MLDETMKYHGMNDNGYIIGESLFDGGKKHAFVLIPQ